MVALADIVCSGSVAKAGKTGQNIKTTIHSRPLSIALKAGKSKPQEMEVNIQKINFSGKQVNSNYLFDQKSPSSIVFALFNCLFQFN